MAGGARHELRRIPSLSGTAPALDTRELPHRPDDLFLDWLREALATGVPEPHAMTLATVDAQGLPDVRTLILKDVGPAGWAFAGRASSAKGTQLAEGPVGALSFWWQPIVRAVRVRGPVVEAGRMESEADLLARSPEARAGVVKGDWTLWRVVPSQVEFWQGSPDRRHIRIHYRLDEDSWVRSVETACTGPRGRRLPGSSDLLADV